MPFFNDIYLLLGMRFFVCLLLLTFATIAVSQQKGATDFEFLKTHIQKAYAGYPSGVKSDAFVKYAETLSRQSFTDTFAVLSKLTGYFNDLHLVLYDYKAPRQTDSNQCKQNERMVRQYFSGNRRSMDKREGYWVSDYGNCIMALMKTSANPLVYKGFLAETSTRALPGYCVLTLTGQSDGTFLTDYFEEGLGYRIFLKSRFRSDGALMVNAYGKWKKLNAYKPGLLKQYQPFDYEPAFTRLDSNTLLLKMADFGGYNVKKYDSILDNNKAIIEKANTLIVDVRNNMGGSVRNYTPWLKYICNKDILRASAEQLCSDMLINDLQEDTAYYRKKGDTVRYGRRLKSLRFMEENRGRFVPAAGDTFRCSGEKGPLNIAVLTNHATLSAGELLVLDFKQSGRVKVFGEPTGGAVDRLDAFQKDLPSGRYRLFIATSRRVLRKGEKHYDNTGILPDVPIPSSVQDWVAFVKAYYEK